MELLSKRMRARALACGLTEPVAWADEVAALEARNAALEKVTEAAIGLDSIDADGFVPNDEDWTPLRNALAALYKVPKPEAN